MSKGILVSLVLFWSLAGLAQDAFDPSKCPKELYVSLNGIEGLASQYKDDNLEVREARRYLFQLRSLSDSLRLKQRKKGSCRYQGNSMFVDLYENIRYLPDENTNGLRTMIRIYFESPTGADFRIFSEVDEISAKAIKLLRHGARTKILTRIDIGQGYQENTQTGWVKEIEIKTN